MPPRQQKIKGLLKEKMVSGPLGPGRRVGQYRKLGQTPPPPPGQANRTPLAGAPSVAQSATQRPFGPKPGRGFRKPGFKGRGNAFGRRRRFGA